MRIRAVSLAILTAFAAACTTPAIHETPEEIAKRIHTQAPVVDGHNDLPWQLRVREGGLASVDLNSDLSETGLHTDIPRLRQGGVGLQLWSAYVPHSTSEDGTALVATMEQIDLIHRMVRQYHDSFQLVSTAAEAKAAIKSGKIASMIGVEGGYSIAESTAVLRNYYQLGVRYMTLTHSRNISWADSATDDEHHGGLTEFGRQVVREMNQIGMLVDISHVSFQTKRDTLATTKAPVIASHSSAYAITPHPRNIPDDILQLIADNGGLVMINFYSGYINKEAMEYMDQARQQREALARQIQDPDQLRAAFVKWREANPMPRGSIQDVADHIDHITKLIGVDYVGIGSDYDGVPTLPQDLGDVSTYPNLTAELIRRGYSEADIIKIMGGNFFRVLEQAELVAASLQKPALAH